MKRGGLLTRRAVLRSAIVGACALRAAAVWRHQEPWPSWQFPPRLLQIEQVVFDARRWHALALAESARKLGASTRAIYGDIHDRWFGHLRSRWNIGRTPLAGITDFRSLFLLQTMAADAGLHPVLRIHHRIIGESIAHEAFGAQAYRAMSTACLTNCREHWTQSAARLVLSLPEPARSAPRHAGNLDNADMRSLGSMGLVTWVMA